MGEQIKHNLISALINRELGGRNYTCEKIFLPIGFHQEDLSLMVRKPVAINFLVFRDKILLCRGKNCILDLHT